MSIYLRHQAWNSLKSWSSSLPRRLSFSRLDNFSLVEKPHVVKVRTLQFISVNIKNAHRKPSKQIQFTQYSQEYFLAYYTYGPVRRGRNP
jgi:hypothetical protein